jgi:hypothetical protein
MKAPPMLDVMGSTGAIAIYLNELAPPAFRGLYPGTVYQVLYLINNIADIE